MDFAYRCLTGQILHARISPEDATATLFLHNRWPPKTNSEPVPAYTFELAEGYDLLGLGYVITEAGIKASKQEENTAPCQTAAVEPNGTRLTPKQFAARYHMHIDKVYYLINNKQLGAITTSSPGSKKPRYLIRQEDIDQFERQRQTKAPVLTQKRRKPKDPDTEQFF